MLTFYNFCFTLRRLPGPWRLLVVLLSFALLQALAISLTVQGRERGVASLLVFTGILAALFFPWAIAFTLESIFLLIYLGVNVALKGWDGMVVSSFIAGTFANLFVVVIIRFLRYAWEVAEEAKQKEKELATLKDQFITNIHHELRTPLVTIQGSLDILRDDGHSLSREEYDQFLGQAVFAGNELQRIADNVLDAMRADSDVSSPQIRVFELDRVVFDVLHHMETFNYALHVDVPESILVRGDSQQVGQVMRNLLSNCFKYVPKGRPIGVRIWRDGAEAVVCVKDGGPGIQASQIPLIFQKFSRLEHDIAGPVRGIGLGLYICRRLVENMGGQIWVESTGVAGEGSSFYFTLPAAVRSIDVFDAQEEGVFFEEPYDDVSLTARRKGHLFEPAPQEQRKTAPLEKDIIPQTEV